MANLRPAWWFGVGLAAALASSAAGQPSTTPGLPAGSQRVDETVGDVGSLQGISRVDLRRELRHPTGFGSVYKLQRPIPMGQPGQTESMFFRIDGGLTAVFNSSYYTPTLQGLMPEVPPGTTFYIGALPRHLSGPPPAPPPSPNRLDLSVRSQAGEPPPPGFATRELPPQATSLWNSEAYRQRHIGELLDRAAAGK